jgi:hypothetical protein
MENNNTVCRCHFCGATNTTMMLASIFLPAGESVCGNCYKVGRMALDNCQRSIKFDENHDEEKPYKVYKVDAFGHKLEVYERGFKRWHNAVNYARKLAKLYID